MKQNFEDKMKDDLIKYKSEVDALNDHLNLALTQVGMFEHDIYYQNQCHLLSKQKIELESQLYLLKVNTFNFIEVYKQTATTELKTIYDNLLEVLTNVHCRIYKDADKEKVLDIAKERAKRFPEIEIRPYISIPVPLQSSIMMPLQGGI